MKKRLLIFFSICFSLANTFCFGNNCTSIGSGPWIPTPIMWSCGSIPSCSDSIIIATGDSIWLGSSLNYTSSPYSCSAAMYLVISGTLAFQTGKKLTLPAGSIITVSPGGRITPGSGGGTSNLISIGGVDVWTAGYGTATGPLSISSSSPLPIELISFSIHNHDSNVAIKWGTASETNNDYFTIEKTEDGFNFEQVGTVDGAGNSTTVINYSYVDTNPYNGDSYYRLKQTDFDGNFSFSPLLSITVSNDLSFNIFPNPSDGSAIQLTLENEGAGEEVLVVVFNSSGAESYSKIIVTEESGESVYAIAPSYKLPAGIYIITATSKQQIYNKKLVVK